MSPSAAAAGATRATVLVVDDTRENLRLMNELLGTDHRVVLASNGDKALQLARQSPQPDLILLDIMMPEMDGFEVCRRLKRDRSTQNIPVIFLTAMDQDMDQEKGFLCGCVDYITKPISPPLMLARVATHLELKRLNDHLEASNAALQKSVQEQTLEVEKLQDVTILAMASMAETRDNETGMHIRRTQHYVRALAEDLHHNSAYADQLDPASIEILFKTAPLHDIGKVGIADSILLKPGKLTEEEFRRMKEHTVIGARILLKAEQAVDIPSAFLHCAREIAHRHHENWDGSGYPDGLAGAAIPLSARLMALADVYDALISKRCYKPAFSHADACAFISEQSGIKFDPEVVAAFHRIADQFTRIAATYADD